MSLFGALYAGVAGLNGQSNALGIISDNISNSNTVGYKQGAGTFQTLVTGTSLANTAGNYSPGGVLSINQQLVSQQGLLQTTSSATDISITGQGLFVVNQKPDGTGQVEYTRAGSFNQDSTGNFVNASGLFLQGWPLDRNGNLPGAVGNVTDTESSANLSSLKTVNVQSLVGTAASTTSVEIGANLNSAQTNYPGAAGLVTMDPVDNVNSQITANTIIVPTTTDHLTVGDQMTVTTGSGLSYTYTYGGFSTGNNVNGSPPANAAPTALNSPPFNTHSNTTVTVNVPSTSGLINGQTVVLNGVTAAVNGVPATDLNGTFVISNITANSYDITVAHAAGTTGTGGTGSPTQQVRPFAPTGAILDSNTVTEPFLGLTGASNFSSSAQQFTITTPATGTVTFSYTSASPNAQLGQFNNMTNLAAAINNVSGLSARVVNGRLDVAATDGEAAVTFANGSKIGTAGPPVQSGIDWVGELGLNNIAASTNRFSTIQGLSNLVYASSGLTGTVSNALSDAALKINVNDPLDTVTFTDGPTHAGSLLSELGLTPTLNGGASPTTPQTTGSLGPAYDPTNTLKNMSSGKITPQFSRPITVYDAQGTSHSLTAGYIKIAPNSWAMEVYATPAADVSTPLTSGQLAYGTVTFNGDGSLRSVSPLLSNPINVNWTNGTTPSTITLDLGTAGQPFGTANASAIGKTDGLSQFDSAYNVNFVNQNGAPVGQLTGVSIDNNGYVIASYSNSETQKLFKIPLAQFSNENGMQSVNGNAFRQTASSGEINLREAGTSGVGSIASDSLEQSSVDVATQLTNMIVAQQAYQANSKIIQTVDTLLQALNQIVQ